MKCNTDTGNGNGFSHGDNNSNERQPNQIMQKQPIITNNDYHYCEVKRKPATMLNSIAMVHVIKTMEHISASQKIVAQACNLHTSIDHPLSARATATNFHITFLQRRQEHHTTPSPMSTSAGGTLCANLGKTDALRP